MNYEPPAAVLPEDLEREIFEISAYSRPIFIPMLMLVARRVKLWVEPLLYRTIVLESWEVTVNGYPVHSWGTLVPILESKPTSFFHNAVRNLFWVASDHHKMLPMQCRSIENLWIAYEAYDKPPDIFPLIEDLPLRQLYCNLTHLFGLQRQIDFDHRIFASVTHLELFDSWMSNSFDPTIWRNLALIPQLSHLSFNDPASVTIWPSLLLTCHSLRVFVALGLFPMQAMINSHQEKEELVEDSRFVIMTLNEATRDWQMGAHTGIDYWSRAEDFIAKRRSGEIDSLQYWIEKDESLNI
ncbi:hypothetical protein B0H19DRAFT_1141137 [Mycena capillaripes]|nr:hypothetical protein B0H19DRAFT_1141137 [Mycena capillaripes]